MARKFTHISTLLQYLHLSLTCMCEAWEDILMQMDLRLTKFVQVRNQEVSVETSGGASIGGARATPLLKFWDEKKKEEEKK